MARDPENILDELLVIRCQDGEREAMARLVARWQERLHAHARRLTGHGDAARDVTQEAWYAIARGIRRLEDPAAFRTWAYRIVSAKAADWIRGRQRDRSASERLNRERGEHDSSEADSDAGDPQRVREAMGRLSLAHREVLALHYGAELSTHEIAAVIAVPQGTVKSRLHHAREALRQALERSEDDVGGT